VDVLLDNISRPATARCRVVDVVLLRRDGVSTRDFQAPSAGVNDIVFGGEAILHRRMLSALVAVVVHFGQLEMRVGAASRRRTAVSARRHADQSNQILGDFTGSDAHLAMVEGIDPGIRAAVRQDWQTQPHHCPFR